MSNDFTKEELEHLSCLVFANQDAYDGFEEFLENKLRSLIDNFCVNNGHIYEFSLGPGYCENCGIHENEAYRLEQELKNE